MHSHDHAKPRFTFRPYSLSLDTVRSTARIIDAMKRHDTDLADQAKRALTSMHLDVAEAMDAAGRNRIARFRIALGSTNEVLACLDIAGALGYTDVTPENADKLMHVRATLLRLVMRKQ